jgi:hypothetical protein
MHLAEKMFSRSKMSCPVRSDCKKESDRRFFDNLFDDDWEVFVIKRNNAEDNFRWFTLCCEAARYYA